jgi:hypothetical protein
MSKAPIAVECGTASSFTTRWIVVKIWDNDAVILHFSGDGEEMWIHAKSPDELRRFLETALKLLDEAVAERNGPKDGQD